MHCTPRPRGNLNMNTSEADFRKHCQETQAGGVPVRQMQSLNSRKKYSFSERRAGRAPRLGRALTLQQPLTFSISNIDCTPQGDGHGGSEPLTGIFCIAGGAQGLDSLRLMLQQWPVDDR